MDRRKELMNIWNNPQEARLSDFLSAVKKAGLRYTGRVSYVGGHARPILLPNLRRVS